MVSGTGLELAAANTLLVVHAALTTVFPYHTVKSEADVCNQQGN